MLAVSKFTEPNKANETRGKLPNNGALVLRFGLVWFCFVFGNAPNLCMYGPKKSKWFGLRCGTGIWAGRMI